MFKKIIAALVVVAVMAPIAFKAASAGSKTMVTHQTRLQAAETAAGL